MSERCLACGRVTLDPFRFGRGVNAYCDRFCFDTHAEKVLAEVDWTVLRPLLAEYLEAVDV